LSMFNEGNFFFFFWKMFRRPWSVTVSWPSQPCRSQDRSFSSLQRSNGGGGLCGSGFNITTRVSKNILDASTHPEWYPLGEISEKLQFPIGFSLHGTVDVSTYLRAPDGLQGPFGLVFPMKYVFYLNRLRTDANTANTPKNKPRMASNLALWGTAASVSVAGPSNGPPTGICQAVVPDSFFVG
jgi:hypothetical protein